MPAADPRSFIKLDEVNEARIKRGIIRGSMHDGDADDDGGGSEEEED